MNHERFVELWNEDVPAKEIAEELGISSNYVSKYAGLHRDECPKRYKMNDFDDEDEEYEENSEISNVFLDTSAISQIKTFDIIDNAKHVIISSLVLRELNNLKDREKGRNTLLYQGIQKLLRACATDVKNEKYSIVNVEYKLGECNDENIARSAAKEKNSAVVTSDYGLCCFCKLHNVSYFLVTSEEVYEYRSVEPSDESIPFSSLLPFSLINEDDKLIITCIKGTIKVIHEEAEVVINPSENTELFEGDSVVITYRTDTHYSVKWNKKKHKLVLMPMA